MYDLITNGTITYSAVDSHKEMVKQMSKTGKIKHEYEIGNDFRGYAASMTE